MDLFEPMNLTASMLYPSQCILGESPLWHAGRKSCYWVDIETSRVFEYRWVDRRLKTWHFDHQVTLVVVDLQGMLVLGLRGGLARFNPETGIFQWLLDIEKEKMDHRCNDGSCDSNGRLWIGTMQQDFEKSAGKLYCIDENLRLHQKLSEVTISNGLVWSPDNSRMYYIDSPTQTVQQFIYNPQTATLRFEKIAIHIPQTMGTPDGMVMDEEAMLWVAHWGGFGVYRWNPFTGKLLQKVQVPVPNVSSCAWVGESLDQLLITTARQHLNEKELEKYPGSGDTFIVKTDAKGRPDFPCKF
jgi:sugar lactone lactonase YvrE